MRTLLILFGVILSVDLQAQDSTIVFQKDECLFSNRYIFYSNGTFKHYFVTDDGQTWFGNGTYSDVRKRRTLSFNDADTTIEKGRGVHYESNFKIILKISGKKFIARDNFFTARKRRLVFVER